MPLPTFFFCSFTPFPVADTPHARPPVRIALIALPYDVLFLATGAMGAMAILAIRFVRQALKAWRWDPSDGS